MRRVFRICCFLVTIVSLSVPAWLGAQQYNKRRQYEVPAVARLCGPNAPVPDHKIEQAMQQAITEGCQEVNVIKTEPHFSLVYGVKILIGEGEPATDIDTAP